MQAWDETGAATEECEGAARAEMLRAEAGVDELEACPTCASLVAPGTLREPETGQGVGALYSLGLAVLGAILGVAVACAIYGRPPRRP